jgi:NADH:ubiquinone oxidoreductase subunit E
MGSSCFARGNNRAIQVLQDYVKGQGLEDVVAMKGVLCEGKCKVGPNVKIDGKAYENVDPSTIIDLVSFHLEQRGMR